MEVTVCGAGNAGHLLAAQFSETKTVNILSLHHAELILSGLKEGGGTITCTCQKTGCVRWGGVNKMHVVSNDPRIVGDSRLVVLALASFSHEEYCKAIAPYLKPKCVVLCLPGLGGFHWTALRHFPRGVIVAGTTVLPFNCRVKKPGQSVQLFGEKKLVEVAVVPPKETSQCIDLMNRLWKGYYRIEPLASPLVLALTPTNQTIHPGRMYAYAQTHPPSPLVGVPLFYEDMTDLDAEWIGKISTDLKSIAAALEKEGVDCSGVQNGDALGYLSTAYGDNTVDRATLLEFFTTCLGYKGIKMPVRELPDGSGVEVDWMCRFVVEDVPFGLCISKGIAQLLEVATPSIDVVIWWAQEVMGKEYLTGLTGEALLDGKDLNETAAPQRFGILTRDQLLGRFEGDKKVNII